MIFIKHKQPHTNARQPHLICLEPRFTRFTGFTRFQIYTQTTTAFMAWQIWGVCNTPLR